MLYVLAIVKKKINRSKANRPSHGMAISDIERVSLMGIQIYIPDTHGQR